MVRAIQGVPIDYQFHEKNICYLTKGLLVIWGDLLGRQTLQRTQKALSFEASVNPRK